MSDKLTLRLRIIITAIVAILIWGHIAWDYFNGGIPTHYLLRNQDLPGIPNWLGGIVLPFFTWFLLYRIHKRIDGGEVPIASENLRSVCVRFLLAMGIAITISILFTHGIDVTGYIMLSIFILAFIFPLYKSEYLLGWVLGSAFTFGAMIPIGFGSILALLFYIFHKISSGTINYFRSKNGNR